MPETTGSTVNQAMVNLATPFVNPAITPEFVARYGANPDASTYVTELYGNVLDRQPDVTGQTYWTGVLSNLLQIDTRLMLARYCWSNSWIPASIEPIPSLTSTGSWRRRQKEQKAIKVRCFNRRRTLRCRQQALRPLW